MFNKKSFRILTSFALVLILVMALAPINAFAEGGGSTSLVPGQSTEIGVGGSTGGSGENEGGDQPGDENNPSAEGDIEEDKDPTADDYASTQFDVWGRKQDGTVYSVDVEWGAMTFQYEANTWDPDNHVTKSGDGWVVYDVENKKSLGKIQHAINRIAVTNHSNAGITATLSYTYTDIEGTDITAGTFAASATAATEDFKATFDATNNKFTLETAANNEGEGDGVGKATVGNAYFTPTTEVTEGIAEWTKIGKITVAIDRATTE